MTYTLYQGDCMDVLRGMTDHSVDAIITDPPYLDGNLSWMLDEFLRVAKRVVLTPGKLESFNWIARRIPVYEYAWQSNSQSMGGRACMHIGWEPILAYHYPLRPLGIDLLVYPIGQPDQANGHVWPKPLELFRKLVRHWTNSGQTVMDPFTGSGTTGVAAIVEGRRFIGVELNPTYYAIAEKRIAHAQPPLFALDTAPLQEQETLFAPGSTF